MDKAVMTLVGVTEEGRTATGRGREGKRKQAGEREMIGRTYATSLPPPSLLRQSTPPSHTCDTDPCSCSPLPRLRSEELSRTDGISLRLGVLPGALREPGQRAAGEGKEGRGG